LVSAECRSHGCRPASSVRFATQRNDLLHAAVPVRARAAYGRARRHGMQRCGNSASARRWRSVTGRVVPETPGGKSGGMHEVGHEPSGSPLVGLLLAALAAVLFAVGAVLQHEAAKLSTSDAGLSLRALV